MPRKLLFALAPVLGAVLMFGFLHRFARVPDRYDNLGKIARVQCPAVILHGTRDEVIPVTMGRTLAAAAPGITFVEVPGAGHNDFPDLDELVGREIGKGLSPLHDEL